MTGEVVRLDRVSNETIDTILSGLDGPLYGVMEVGTNSWAMYRDILLHAWVKQSSMEEGLFTISEQAPRVRGYLLCEVLVRIRAWLDPAGESAANPVGRWLVLRFSGWWRDTPSHTCLGIKAQRPFRSAILYDQ